MQCTYPQIAPAERADCGLADKVGHLQRIELIVEQKPGAVQIADVSIARGADAAIFPAAFAAESIRQTGGDNWLSAAPPERSAPPRMYLLKSGLRPVLGICAPHRPSKVGMVSGRLQWKQPVVSAAVPKPRRPMQQHGDIVDSSYGYCLRCCCRERRGDRHGPK